MIPPPPVLAAYEEARIARSLGLLAPETLRVGGGVACRGEPGLWLNKAVGMGMGVAVSDADIGAVIAFFEEKGIEPRIETCPLAHETLTRALADAGFVVRRWAHVLARETDEAERGVGVDAGTGGGGGREVAGAEIRGLEFRVVTSGDAKTLDLFARTAHAGFAKDATPPTEFQLGVWTSVVRDPHTIALLAIVDGRAAGAACLEVHPPFATLFAACVVHEFRNRGLQRAMMEERLRLARQRGAEIGLVATDPEGPTERNARRAGFVPAYTHVSMVRARASSGLAWRVSAVPEAVGRVGGRDLIEDGLHRFPQGVPGAAGQRPQQLLDLGEDRSRSG